MFGRTFFFPGESVRKSSLFLPPPGSLPIRTDKRRIDSHGVLQGFYRDTFPLGAEALLPQKATFDKALSRARVPETISPLWAIG